MIRTVYDRDPDRKVEIVDSSTPEDIANGIFKVAVTITVPVITIKFTIDEPLELPTEIKLE